MKIIQVCVSNVMVLSKQNVHKMPYTLPKQDYIQWFIITCIDIPLFLYLKQLHYYT